MEESGSKRLPSAANEEAPPTKRNKVDKDGSNGQNEDKTDDVNKGMKVEDNNEDEGVQVVMMTESWGPARGQGRTAATANWAELPTALLGRAFEWLSFTEGRHFFACNSVLWRQKRVEYDSQMMHKLVLPGMPPCSFLDTLAEVHTLDFGPHCKNEILKYMRDERVLPKLKHLGMARSVKVTDNGLAFLAENPARCRTLETLDVTFCRQPTYGAMLLLKGRLKAFDANQNGWTGK